MKMYQVVQKISIHPLYLKPATPLSRFSLGCHGTQTIQTHLLPTAKKLVAMVTMVHKQHKTTV
jgi:hypothetical protein